MSIVGGIIFFLRALLWNRAAITAENLALRQQVTVLRVSAKRPRLRRRDRILRVSLSRLWADWRSCLLIVKPETVIRWHRQGFRLYWRWRSRKKTGRPAIGAEIRNLIRRMSRDNQTWGAPRIQSEFHLLGFAVAESTVAKYMCLPRKRPSQTWRTLLENHVAARPHTNSALGTSATTRMGFSGTTTG